MSRFLALVFVALIGALIGALPAAKAAEMEVVLDLVTLVDGAPTSRTTLLADNPDPNRVGVDDRFRLEVDGRKVRVANDVLANLNRKRAQFSYDHRTGGIARTGGEATCLLGGPAMGEILTVRYVTYENGLITGSALQEVLSQAGNCLFTSSIQPRRQQALLAAAQAMAILQTLRDLNR